MGFSSLLFDQCDKNRNQLVFVLDKNEIITESICQFKISWTWAFLKLNSIKCHWSYSIHLSRNLSKAISQLQEVAPLLHSSCRDAGFQPLHIWHGFDPFRGWTLSERKLLCVCDTQQPLLICPIWNLSAPAASIASTSPCSQFLTNVSVQLSFQCNYLLHL